MIASTKAAKPLPPNSSPPPGATTVRPFDDAWIIAGQGTAGLEAAQDAAAQGITFGSLICNASGGGLLAGVAVAFEALSRKRKSTFPSPPAMTSHPLARGKRRSSRTAPGIRSIADALMSPEPGIIPFEVRKRRVAGGFTATNDQLLDAMSYAFHNLKLVVEPGSQRRPAPTTASTSQRWPPYYS